MDYPKHQRPIIEKNRIIAPLSVIPKEYRAIYDGRLCIISSEEEKEIADHILNQLKIEIDNNDFVFIAGAKGSFFANYLLNYNIQITRRFMIENNLYGIGLWFHP